MDFYHHSGILRAFSLFLALSLFALPALAEDDHPDLNAFATRIDRLVDSPGASNSVAAGLINPAAWPVQGHGGLYLAWEEPAEESDEFEVDDFLGVLSLGPLAFGMNRLVYDHAGGGSRHLYDYTLGLGGGDRSSSFAVSYAWRRGYMGAPEAGFGPSERLTAGVVQRWREASLGLTYAYERESTDSFYQADLGIRPLGPRWTLFGDVVFRDGDALKIAETEDEYDDFVFGFGAKVDLVPGLTLAARGRDSGEFSLRIDVALPDGGLGSRRQTTRLSGRAHFDDDQEHASTTLAMELTEGHNIGQIAPFRHETPEMHLKGGLTYRNYRYFDERRSLMGTLRQISDYAQDPAVDGLVINLSGFRTTPANLWELRAQLAGFRAEGKKLIIYIDRVGLFDYMLATVADELWMDPQGEIDIKGIDFGRTYISRMLDKMGIGIDEWRYFTYKSAMEGFSRTSMSDADREQFMAFAQDWYDEAVRLTLAARGLDESAWNGLRDDQGYLIAVEALDAGLVDKIGDFHEAKDAADEAGRRTTADLVAAPMRGLTGDPVWGPEEWGEPPRIALLYAIGGCEMDAGIKGRELSKKIRDVRKDSEVKAVVLRADSPGGDPLPSDLVARELKETMADKPVMVSQGQVAASGGYWISMHSDAIYASPYTLTGSIGVISGHFWDKSLGEKIGMDFDHVQIGEHADIFNGPSLPLIGIKIPHRPVTEKERERGERIIKDLYHDFLAQVAEGRNMNVDDVDAIAQGRVWSGDAGLENGLVDEIGGLWQTLLSAKEAAGIPADRPVKIVEGPSLGPFNLSFLEPRLWGLRMPGFGVKEVADEGELLSGEPWDRLAPQEKLYLEMLLQSQDKAMLLMRPIAVEGATLVP